MTGVTSSSNNTPQNLGFSLPNTEYNLGGFLHFAYNDFLLEYIRGETRGKTINLLNGNNHDTAFKDEIKKKVRTWLKESNAGQRFSQYIDRLISFKAHIEPGGYNALKRPNNKRRLAKSEGVGVERRRNRELSIKKSISDLDYPTKQFFHLALEIIFENKFMNIDEFRQNAYFSNLIYVIFYVRDTHSNKISNGANT